jgi:hypothetical protein
MNQARLATFIGPKNIEEQSDPSLRFGISQNDRSLRQSMAAFSRDRHHSLPTPLRRTILVGAEVFL